MGKTDKTDKRNASLMNLIKRMHGAVENVILRSTASRRIISAPFWGAAGM